MREPRRTSLGIVVPCHNDARFLRRSLPALRRSLEGFDYRMLVVVDRCTDDSAKVASNQGAEITIKERSKWKNSTAENLNIGLIELRDSDYLAVIAADTLLSSAYLTECVKALESGGPPPSAGGILISTSGFYRAYQMVLDRLGMPHKPRGTGRVYKGEVVRHSLAEFGTVFRDVLGEDSEFDIRIGESTQVSAKMFDVRGFSLRKSIIGQLRSGKARRELGIPMSSPLRELFRVRPFVLVGYLLGHGGEQAPASGSDRS